MLKANDSIPPDTQVSLTIEVKGSRLRSPVRLAEGHVVRGNGLEPEAGFAIAIECERPLPKSKIIFRPLDKARLDCWFARMKVQHHFFKSCDGICLFGSQIRIVALYCRERSILSSI